MTADQAKTQLLLDCEELMIPGTISECVPQTFDDILTWKGGDVDAAYEHVKQELADLGLV